MRSPAAAERATAAEFAESSNIVHDMIGGESKHDDVAVASVRIRCASDDRGTGIASYWLEQDIGFRSDRGELLGNEKSVPRVGNDDGPAK